MDPVAGGVEEFEGVDDSGAVAVDGGAPSGPVFREGAAPKTFVSKDRDAESSSWGVCSIS